MPTDEAQRLDSLRSFEILDSLPESEFDDFALLAAHICETPFALLNVIAEDRQWSKASVGIEPGDLRREDAFCATTIVEPDGLLVVPDASADPRFAENPLVVGDAGVRFYAGAAIVSTEGQAIGALCVLDRRSRSLRPDQVRALQALARQVSARLEQRRAVTIAARQVAEAGSYATGRPAVDVASSFPDAFDDASAGIALTRLDGVLVRVNDALARTLNRPAGTLVGQSYSDFVHHEDQRDVAHTFERLIDGTAASLVVPARLLSAGGEPVPVSLTSSAVRGADGSTQLILTMVEDVSTQLALADEFTGWSGADALTRGSRGVAAPPLDGCAFVVGDRVRPLLTLRPGSNHAVAQPHAVVPRLSVLARCCPVRRSEPTAQVGSPAVQVWIEPVVGSAHRPAGTRGLPFDL